MRQNYRSPDPRLCGANWDLDAGYYELTIIPLKKGIGDVLFRPRGLLDSILSAVGWEKTLPRRA